MKRSYKNHIPYTIAAFATILAIAFYFKSNTLNNELNKIKSKSISKSDSIAYATHLKTYNTLLDKGNYKGALDIILENENTISVHSKIESELLKELILFKTKYKNIKKNYY